MINHLKNLVYRNSKKVSIHEESVLPFHLFNSSLVGFNDLKNISNIVLNHVAESEKSKQSDKIFIAKKPSDSLSPNLHLPKILESLRKCKHPNLLGIRTLTAEPEAIMMETEPIICTLTSFLEVFKHKVKNTNPLCHQVSPSFILASADEKELWDILKDGFFEAFEVLPFIKKCLVEEESKRGNFPNLSSVEKYIEKQLFLSFNPDSIVLGADLKFKLTLLPFFQSTQGDTQRASYQQRINKFDRIREENGSIFLHHYFENLTSDSVLAGLEPFASEIKMFIGYAREYSTDKLAGYKSKVSSLYTAILLQDASIEGTENIFSSEQPRKPSKNTSKLFQKSSEKIESSKGLFSKFRKTDAFQNRNPQEMHRNTGSSEGDLLRDFAQMNMVNSFENERISFSLCSFLRLAAALSSGVASHNSVSICLLILRKLSQILPCVGVRRSGETYFSLTRSDEGSYIYSFPASSGWIRDFSVLDPDSFIADLILSNSTTSFDSSSKEGQQSIELSSIDPWSFTSCLPILLAFSKGVVESVIKTVLDYHQRVIIPLLDNHSASSDNTKVMSAMGVLREHSDLLSRLVRSLFFVFPFLTQGLKEEVMSFFVKGLWKDTLSFPFLFRDLRDDLILFFSFSTYISYNFSILSSMYDYYNAKEMSPLLDLKKVFKQKKDLLEKLKRIQGSSLAVRAIGSEINKGFEEMLVNSYNSLKGSTKFKYSLNRDKGLTRPQERIGLAYIIKSLFEKLLFASLRPVKALGLFCSLEELVSGNTSTLAYSFISKLTSSIVPTSNKEEASKTASSVSRRSPLTGGNLFDPAIFTLGDICDFLLRFETESNVQPFDNDFFVLGSFVAFLCNPIKERKDSVEKAFIKNSHFSSAYSNSSSFVPMKWCSLYNGSKLLNLLFPGAVKDGYFNDSVVSSKLEAVSALSFFYSLNFSKGMDFFGSIVEVIYPNCSFGNLGFFSERLNIVETLLSCLGSFLYIIKTIKSLSFRNEDFERIIVSVDSLRSSFVANNNTRINAKFSFNNKTVSELFDGIFLKLESVFEKLSEIGETERELVRIKKAEWKLLGVYNII